MELKEIDGKILYTLDFDARMPMSKLAKQLRMSKQALNYRFERLQKEGIIQGFYADIDPSKLGLTIYILYLKFHHLTLAKEKELIEHLNKQKQISVNASINGKWDHSIAIFAHNIQEFNEIYNEIMRNYEEYVKEKLITITTDFRYYKPKYLVSKPTFNKEIKMSNKIEESRIDKIDRKILKILAEQARIPLIDLAEKLNLTPNAIKARIKSLEKKEIILGYRVMINHEKFKKLHYRVFFFLENITAQQEALKTFLSLQPQVISITKTIGYCDIECRLLVDNLEEFYSLMNIIKSRFSDVLKDFEPIIYYKFYKSLNYYPVE